MRKQGVLLSTAVIAAASLAAPAAAISPAVQTVRTARVSVDSRELQGNDISGRSARPALNADGTVIAFDSIADNLVTGDTNQSDDVFVRNRTTGRTHRVSVSSTGVQANGTSSRPDVSNDGRYVVFDSSASNLVPGDTNNRTDVFMHDRMTGETTLVSQSSSGQQGNDSSFSPVISGNGHLVAFTTNATNLTRRPTNGAIVIRNLLTGRTSIGSFRLDGTAAPAASPSLSANGRYLAFASFVPDVVAGDTNDAFDVFVRDRRLGITTRVSVDSEGAEAQGGGSFEPSLSADGHEVAFASEATNLVADDTNGVQDIFAHDMSNGTTQRVSVASDGSQADGQSDGPGIRGGSTFGPDISADGTKVAFDSIATNLVADDSNICTYSPGGQSFPEPGECPDVFVRDLSVGTTVRVSVSTAGAQEDDASTDPAISANGLRVAFFSAAAFVTDDTNTCQPFFLSHAGQCPDVYLHTTKN